MKKIRVLVIGTGGFLGKTMHQHFLSSGIETKGAARNPGPGELKLDLERPIAAQLEAELRNGGYTHGIFCAAMADVEACYKDPEKSRRVNVSATEEILGLFHSYKVTPVFFSSDLVFENSKDFYTEEEPVSPRTLYGRQKAAAEEMVRNGFPEHLIFRTSKLMSLRREKRNILSDVVVSLEQNIPVKSFRDQFITPAFVEDVSAVTELSIRAGLSGTFHLATKEKLSRLEIARAICERMGKPRDLVVPISVNDMAFSEPRGCFYTLNAERIRQALGFEFRPVEAGLRALIP